MVVLIKQMVADLKFICQQHPEAGWYRPIYSPDDLEAIERHLVSIPMLPPCRRVEVETFLYAIRVVATTEISVTTGLPIVHQCRELFIRSLDGGDEPFEEWVIGQFSQWDD